MSRNDAIIVGSGISTRGQVTVKPIFNGLLTIRQPCNMANNTLNQIVVTKECVPALIEALKTQLEASE